MPKASEQTFDLPVGLFRNGWIHLPEDSELAFLMMVALVSQRGSQGDSVKIASGVLLHYGIGRDAYEAHKTLHAFGLLDVHVAENRHDDGKVANYGKGGAALLHASQLPDGSDEPAAARLVGGPQTDLRHNTTCAGRSITASPRTRTSRGLPPAQ